MGAIRKIRLVRVPEGIVDIGKSIRPSIERGVNNDVTGRVAEVVVEVAEVVAEVVEVAAAEELVQ